MNPVGIILGIALVAIPPLTEDQRIRLATAFDGRDHQEAAFGALIENARVWTAGIGDAAIRLHPNLAAMLDDPEVYRGTLCQITGRLQQQTTLPAPYQGVTEWFVRDESGQPILVYVVSYADDPAIVDGQAVILHGRYYKRIDEIARDGVSRSYPAFVGAFPRRPTDTEGAVGGIAVIVIPVAVLLVVFIVLMLYVRRNRVQRHNRRSASGERIKVDETPGLPDDPVAALNEMRRRAEADSA